MVNRLLPPIEGPGGRGSAPDYWVIVTTDCEIFYVSEETARAVLRRLARWWVPRWLSFTDLRGGRVRVRSARVESVQEWTKEQRAALRALQSSLRAEAEADRNPWDEDTPW